MLDDAVVDAGCSVQVAVDVVDGVPVVGTVSDAVVGRPGLGYGAVAVVAVVMCDAFAGDDGVIGSVADVVVAVASAAAAFVEVGVGDGRLEATFGIAVGADVDDVVAVAGVGAME